MERYSRAKFLAWKTLGENTLIIDSRVGKSVHKLNHVGSFLWNNLDDNSTEQDLKSKLMNEYEVDENAAIQDIKNFINDLLERSLIHE